MNLSSQVHIWTAQHDWESPDFAYEVGPVTIGSRAWIGPRVTILPGSTIGEGAVVAAGAVVKGEVAPYSMVAGIPAREIRKRPINLTYRLASPRNKVWWW